MSRARKFSRVRASRGLSAELLRELKAPVEGTVDSHRACFDRWSPVAMEIPTDEVLVPTVDGALAQTNAVTGLQRLREHHEAVQQIPTVKHGLVWGLEEIAFAYLFAVSLWRTNGKENSQPIRPLLKQVRADRRRLLTIARAALELQVIAPGRVAHVGKGFGNTAFIRDVLDLIVVLREEAPRLVSESGLVGPAWLAEAEARALEAQNHSRPVGAPRPPRQVPEQIAKLQLLRNQLWTLLVRAHDEALLAAAHIVGPRRMEELVPPLGYRKRARRKASEEEQEKQAEK